MFSEERLSQAIDKHIPDGATLRSDGKATYMAAAYRKELNHERAVAMKNPDLAHEHFHWINIVISNLKRYLLSTHHGVFKGHLKQLPGVTSLTGGER
ncbi:MAG: hypothetical protein CL678_03740 [Bdellovibrionaceae bacterium]|nr:hypothetical protein [Pseudobdellovibrionaceae bacterium]|tara:strand:+ start:444 stop:734 length:291 start_codon:yes stop_codon:yes gene_type:complete